MRAHVRRKGSHRHKPCADDGQTDKVKRTRHRILPDREPPAPSEAVRAGKPTTTEGCLAIPGLVRFVHYNRAGAYRPYRGVAGADADADAAGRWPRYLSPITAGVMKVGPGALVTL